MDFNLISMLLCQIVLKINFKHSSHLHTVQFRGKKSANCFGKLCNPVAVSLNTPSLLHNSKAFIAQDSCFK